MQGEMLLYGPEQETEDRESAKILLIDDNARDLAAYSSTLRQEGFKVRAFDSYPEGLSCLGSEHFDLVMVKHRGPQSLEEEKAWSVQSRGGAGPLSRFWHAVSMGNVTLMWSSWDDRTN